MRRYTIRTKDVSPTVLSIIETQRVRNIVTVWCGERANRRDSKCKWRMAQVQESTQGLFIWMAYVQRPKLPGHLGLGWELEGRPQLLTVDLTALTAECIHHGVSEIPFERVTAAIEAFRSQPHSRGPKGLEILPSSALPR